MLPKRKFLRVEAPTAWTTIALTVHVDGRVEGRLVGASSFPRHWVYGPDGRLVAKSGLVDFADWYRTSTFEQSPWAGMDRAVLVARAESEAERGLSVTMMDTEHTWRRLAPGEVLCHEGDAAEDVYLVHDGLLTVTREGRTIAELGPGAVVGEMSFVGAGRGPRRRNATVRAATAARVGVVAAHLLPADQLDRVAGTRSNG